LPGAPPQIMLHTRLAEYRTKKGRGKEGGYGRKQERGWEIEEKRSYRTLPIVLQVKCGKADYMLSVYILYA